VAIWAKDRLDILLPYGLFFVPDSEGIQTPFKTSPVRFDRKIARYDDLYQFVPVSGMLTFPAYPFAVC
jgi:hypothetical protein